MFWVKYQSEFSTLKYLFVCSYGNLNIVLSIVCQAMSSSEDKAYEIMRELDVSYVLVIFGGLTGYSSDGK